jgi:hypothetical protein
MISTRPSRRALALTIWFFVFLLGSSPAYAHGVGGRQDLPLPLNFFIVGAGIVIVISFVLLEMLWRSPRLQAGPKERPLPGGPLWQGLGLLSALLGLVWLGLVVADGFVGESGGSSSPILVWIGFWLIIPFLSAVFGNLYASFSPWRTLGPIFGTGSRTSSKGIWPAVVVFFVFAWLELIPTFGGQATTLAAVAIGYSLWLFGWTYALGTDGGLLAADVFTTYNRLISAIAPIGRNKEGIAVWRGWLRALPVLPQWPGLTWFVLIMIGTVTYDGLSGAPIWRQWFGGLAFNVGFNTIAMASIIAIVALGYFGSTAAAARLSETDRTGIDVANSFAHTLVPIALAYAFAHYFTLVIFEGQLLFRAASDPFGLGWDLFGTAERAIDFTILPTALIWWIQLVTIVTGHIVGVVLAHDRALAEFPARTAVKTQWAMLVLMVALTGIGLFVLAEG